jgi:hypothetical protein
MIGRDQILDLDRDHAKIVVDCLLHDRKAFDAEPVEIVALEVAPESERAVRAVAQRS